MKKEDVQKLYDTLGQNLHLANIYYGDEVHGTRISMSYEEAKDLYFMMQKMLKSNSVIWEDE